MTLQELQVGKSAYVLAVAGEDPLRHRLLELGITPKTVITLRKTAPFGDPLEIKLRGYVLTLRREEARRIMVQEIIR
ncbi:MAG: FeoA family protein [Thermoguttaceae bacterium]